MSSSRPGLRRHLSAHRLAVFGGTAVAAVLVAIASGIPATLLLWAALVSGATISGLVAAGMVPLRSPGHPPDDPGGQRGRRPLRDRLRALRRRWKLTASLAAVVGLLLTFGGLHLLRGAADCPPATQLRLVTDAETIVTARRLAAAYERSTARTNDGCPKARIYAYAVSDSTTIRKRLAPNDGWSDNYGALSRVGPRPDIWLAGTAHQVDLVNDPAAGPSPIERTTTIARSPLVLAVPAGPVEQQQRTWSELFRQFTDRGPGIVRGNPASDDLDMLATVPLYESASAGGGRLSPAEIERRIQSTADAGRFPIIGDASDLLCHRRRLTEEGADPAPPGRSTPRSSRPSSRWPGSTAATRSAGRAARRRPRWAPSGSCTRCIPPTPWTRTCSSPSCAGAPRSRSGRSRPC